MIPRAIHQIFSTLDDNDAEYTVKCSFLELYNEETTDLLAVGEAVDQKLKMLEDNGRVVVQVTNPCCAALLLPYFPRCIYKTTNDP